jgi:GT2 family glycosyltransferase
MASVTSTTNITSEISSMPGPPPRSATVVIVTWNAREHLPRCLAAVAAQTVPPDRLILIDNGSTDGTPSLARECVAAEPGLSGRTEIVELGGNLGFAAANNRAIVICDTEYVALLNPDAFPHPDWLERLLAAADRHPEAASFGSRQMTYGHPGIVDGLGDVYHASGLSWRRGHGRRLEQDDLVEREIFSACAAAALYRRAALVDVGGFDEDFFCYFEDVDLGFRLRLAGFASVSVPDAVVDHVGSASSGGKRSEFAAYHGHRNLVWCFLKNMPRPLFILLLPAHFIQFILVGLVFWARGQGRVFAKAKWHALKNVRQFWKKRAVIQKSCRASSWAIWKVLNTSLWRS